MTAVASLRAVGAPVPVTKQTFNADCRKFVERRVRQMCARLRLDESTVEDVTGDVLAYVGAKLTREPIDDLERYVSKVTTGLLTDLQRDRMKAAEVVSAIVVSSRDVDARTKLDDRRIVENRSGETLVDVRKSAAARLQRYRDALDRAGGRVVVAAELLGVSRRALDKHLKAPLYDEIPRVTRGGRRPGAGRPRKAKPSNTR